MGREPGIRPTQLTCPNTNTDYSDQSVPVLFVPLFLEGRDCPGIDRYLDTTATVALTALPGRLAPRRFQRPFMHKQSTHPGSSRTGATAPLLQLGPA